jgi:hypothetical protein
MAGKQGLTNTRFGRPHVSPAWRASACPQLFPQTRM